MWEVLGSGNASVNHKSITGQTERELTNESTAHTHLYDWHIFRCRLIGLKSSRLLYTFKTKTVLPCADKVGICPSKVLLGRNFLGHELIEWRHDPHYWAWI